MQVYIYIKKTIPRLQFAKRLPKRFPKRFPDDFRNGEILLSLRRCLRHATTRPVWGIKQKALADFGLRFLFLHWQCPSYGALCGQHSGRSIHRWSKPALKVMARLWESVEECHCRFLCCLSFFSCFWLIICAELYRQRKKKRPRNGLLTKRGDTFTVIAPLTKTNGVWLWNTSALHIRAANRPAL